MTARYYFLWNLSDFKKITKTEKRDFDFNKLKEKGENWHFKGSYNISKWFQIAVKHCPQNNFMSVWGNWVGVLGVQKSWKCPKIRVFGYPKISLSDPIVPKFFCVLFLTKPHALLWHRFCLISIIALDSEITRGVYLFRRQLWVTLCSYTPNFYQGHLGSKVNTK